MTAFGFATCAALSCLLPGRLARASAAQYEVEGWIEQTLYKMDGSVQSEAKVPFTVFVNDASWLIQTTNLDADGNPRTMFETASTNGGVIYSVGVPAEKNAPTPLNSAVIYSNDVPVGETDGDCIGHLWLMFASGWHLKNLSTNWLTPVYDLNASASVNATMKRQAKWELSNGPGSLPLNVTYYRDGQDSAIDATYAAAGVTNAGDIKIPVGFVFEQRVGARFAPGPIQPGDAASDYRIRKRAVATVTAVRPHCSRTEFAPGTTGITQVTDERLARVPNANPRMHYRFTDGVRWVSVEQARRMAASQLPPRNPPPRAIVVVVLLLPAAVVLALWVLNRNQRADVKVDLTTTSSVPPGEN